MTTIARDLHCDAVRISGADPERIAVAGGLAAAHGLQVWFAPFPCDLPLDETAAVLHESAERAERLRETGADVVLVLGCEFTLFVRGFLPGDTLLDRIGALTAIPAGQGGDGIDAARASLDRFRRFLTPRSRTPATGSPARSPTPAAAGNESIGRFSISSRSTSIATPATPQPMPTRSTGTSQPTARWRSPSSGAARTAAPQKGADSGGTSSNTPRVLANTGVEIAFWFTFASWVLPASDDPAHDLDLAGYGLLTVTDDGLRPKLAFHALADACPCADGEFNRSSYTRPHTRCCPVCSKKELINEQAEFWVVLARGVTLQAACDAVGVNRRTGRRWRQLTRGRIPRKPAPRGAAPSGSGAGRLDRGTERVNIHHSSTTSSTAPTAHRDAVSGAVPRTLSASVAWAVVLGAAVAQCVPAHTVGEWASGALLVAWALAAEVLLGVPGRAWMPLPVQLLLPLAAIVAAIAVIPLNLGRSSWQTPDTAIGLVVLALIIAAGVLSRVPHRRMRTTAPLRFPLDEGRWRVAEGESRLLNHHWTVPAQRAALDLVRVGRTGMSRRWRGSGHAGAYFAYGTQVSSPCDGTVVVAHDGEDDTRSRNAPPPGNHVVIETADGIRIVLAHLRRGSVMVVAGRPVRMGEPVGRVGNSGNSTEPHLHIHAQRGGTPIRLRFSGRRRTAPRGATIWSARRAG